MDWNNINADKDTSGLGPIEYDQSKVPSLIRKHADNVRGKSYGHQVREAQARNDEYAGLIANEANSKVDEQDIYINDLSGQFNNAINGVTTDTEIIDARLAEGLDVGYQTLKQRLDATVVYTPEMFGAIGDGVTDDYEAFRKMSQFISTRKTANILFGQAKTYYLDLIFYA